jgi:ribosome-associated protein
VPVTNLLPPNFLPPASELTFEFSRASGPGGQNVNKVSTAVRLRFDIGRSRSLQDEVKERLVQLAGNRVTRGGVLVIEARRFRTQEKNRQDALERLRLLLARAGRRPKRRKPTKPTRESRGRRLEHKRRRSATKSGRGAVISDD